jgi:hypothetical protein
MAAPKPSSQEQEQAIKARKQLLFEVEEQPGAVTRKPFAEYLRETPAAPLSGGMKAALWAAGAVALLMLVLALVKGGREKRPSSPGPAVSSPASRPR